MIDEIETDLFTAVMRYAGQFESYTNVVPLPFHWKVTSYDKLDDKVSEVQIELLGKVDNHVDFYNLICSNKSLQFLEATPGAIPLELGYLSLHDDSIWELETTVKLTFTNK